MRLSLRISAMILVALVVLSCDESAKPAMVWGTMWAMGTKDSSGNNGPVSVNGYTLGETGEDLMGFCRYKNGKFSFAVGTDSPSDIALSSDYYFSIEGIKGPPSSNPYDTDGLPRADETGLFTDGQIYTSAGAWIIDESNLVPDRCLVSLFAEASAGDLTPLEYSKKSFQYLVNIDCGNGLDNVFSRMSPADPASELRGFEVTLWFNNCEE